MTRKDYRHGDLVVSYDPDTCIHAAECVRGLPKVFDPDARPWIRPGNAPAQDVLAVVRKCPSGALEARIEPSVPVPKEAPMSADAPATKVTPLANGPYIVEGNVVVVDATGKVVKEAARMALCRCGASAHKPFCDGTHGKIGFQAP